MNIRAILLKPMVNEKSMMLVKTGLYTFAVDSSATKQQIAKVVAAKFKVDVVSVKTVNVKGKIKSQRTRKGYFQRPDIKKAIVRVRSGQKIPLFESPDKEEVTVTTAEGESVAKTREKKSLLKGTKVKIEKVDEGLKESKQKSEPRKSAKQTGKTRGEK